MIHTIKCKICNEVKKVNGQKQISSFAGNHNHGSEHARITGCNIELDNPQDRINLKIDKPALITGTNATSVKDYWRKVPGSI